MYIGVDIGGTKTLLAVLNEQGEIREEVKFPTPKNYDHFLLELRHTLAHLKQQDFKAGAVAVPGRLDRKHGRLLSLANLPWKNKPIQADCERIFACPIVIENDANLAGLSEAMLHKEYDRVLYMTVSTGIGIGVVEKQRLDPALLDAEGGQIFLPHKDKLARWESFASGRAIYEHFGKKAMEIPASDTKSWGYVVRNLAVGLSTVIAITEPDLVVIGGSVGTYFDRYSKLLDKELKKYQVPVVKHPKIVQAGRPEKAVVYGCYDLAKQEYSHATAH